MARATLKSLEEKLSKLRDELAKLEKNVMSTSRDGQRTKADFVNAKKKRLEWGTPR